jgi:hypothetical protein
MAFPVLASATRNSYKFWTLNQNSALVPKKCARRSAVSPDGCRPAFGELGARRGRKPARHVKPPPGFDARDGDDGRALRRRQDRQVHHSVTRVPQNGNALFGSLSSSSDPCEENLRCVRELGI